jgi:HD-GYP domain-containing protein (c-di-GMP phosphodiesterase class II)
MSISFDTARALQSAAFPDAAACVTPISTMLDRLCAEPRLVNCVISRPHPLLVSLRKEQRFVLIGQASVWDRGREVLRPFTAKFAEGEAMLLLLGRPAEPDLAQVLNHGLGALIPAEPNPDEVFVAIHNAFELMEAKARAESRGKWLNRYRFELGELIEIAKAITTEREIEKLLGLILEKSRFITGADAGSIYVVEGDDADPRRRTLRFKLSQNDSVTFDSSEFTVPVSARSMAGYVALERKPLGIDDVYVLPADSPYALDRSFDDRIGYRTKSMLCAPLLSRTGEAVGVIQLINKKRDPEKKLLNAEDFEHQVIPFDERSEQLLSTLASQAGIALENAVLYNEIQRMLEGFVRASVEAIEQRDPTTSGHSRRVADFTHELALIVEQVDKGPYREVRWTRDELRELEYASLLHDFGKIGVREEVLLKAKKLFPLELENIRRRFDVAIRSVEVDVLSRKLHLLKERGEGAAEFSALDQELAKRKADLQSALCVICAANEPSLLSGGEFARIEAMARETYMDIDGRVWPLLLPSEVECLSIARGSLTGPEMEEIRSHVSRTYKFLSQIPWGKQFRRVAVIAGSHHERLNGTGYPNRHRAEEIPLQSKMMSVSDIFDALTASDRPYKKAVPLEKAIEILNFEVKDQHLDRDLVELFVEAKVWTRPSKHRPGFRA